MGRNLILQILRRPGASSQGMNGGLWDFVGKVGVISHTRVPPTLSTTIPYKKQAFPRHCYNRMFVLAHSQHTLRLRISYPQA